MKMVNTYMVEEFIVEHNGQPLKCRRKSPGQWSAYALHKGQMVWQALSEESSEDLEERRYKLLFGRNLEGTNILEFGLNKDKT